MRISEGLRALADWYEAHPDMPAPSDSALCIYALDTKEEAASVVAALGNCSKEYSESCVTLNRDFGGISLRFVFSRSSICRKKVLGTLQVAEEVIPAHEKEIVEWECDPILERA